MPASSSIAMAIGRAARLGANSTRNTAIPVASGNAINSDRNAVTSVPTIGPAAP